MQEALTNLVSFARSAAPYAAVFFAALALSLVLVPQVRRLALALGMVDMPGPRRINRSPIPRAGGLAVFLAFAIALVGYAFATGRTVVPGIDNSYLWRMVALTAVLCAIGFLDDRFSLPAPVKLAGQVAVALGAVFWAGIGFRFVFSSLPAWIDVPLTVFWIVGAINAFNLIDGLDGLASGLAVIAAAGMAGSLFFIGSPAYTIVHLALMGACLGFLRYNFNPASVFLGDTGSMFLGFVISTMPLGMRASDSFLVSVGVPLLAMGVPIFDTFLAILRRTIRAALKRAEAGDEQLNGKVMRADADHLHHRILRRVSSQRSAAMILYGMAALSTATGISAVALRDRAAALFVVAFVVAVFVMVNDMSRVELWDAGRLANAVVHEELDFRSRRRRAAFLVPMYMLADFVLMCAVWLGATVITGGEVTGVELHTMLPLFIAPPFIAMAVMRAYRTVWSRAVPSNYIRLIIAVYTGGAATLAGAMMIGRPAQAVLPVVLVFSGSVAVGVCIVRMTRSLARNFFYYLGNARMRDEKGTVRVIVYGAGLRYRAFRREMVRSIGVGRDRRVIVGILDDDILLKDHFIGGQRVLGTLRDAREVVRAMRADMVVVACELAPERLEYVREVFASCGVSVHYFSFNEKTL